MFEAWLHPFPLLCVLKAFLIALPVGAAILVPSLLFLFSLFATAKPQDVEAP